MSLVANEFRIVVSMSDLVVWSGDQDDKFSPHPALDAITTSLGISVDIKGLHALYFEATPIGTGDVHVFSSTSVPTNVFAIDIYRDLTDQLDVIAIGVRCDETAGSIVKASLRCLFDSASYQVCYEEANVLVAFRSMIDASKFPRSLGRHGYLQKLLVHRDG